MGCCESSNADSLSASSFAEKMKTAIESGSVNRVSMILSMFKKKSIVAQVPYIDMEIYSINNIKLNPLAYALFIGKLSIFKFLYEKGASIVVMEELLEGGNLRAINIICYKGHKDLLEFYLPIYLKEYNSLPMSNKSFTIDLKDTATTKNEYDYAIHSACRAGMIHIVLFLYKYFKDKPYCPREFDIYYCDEYYGEDAGLIACRVGCFALVKMLHEVCGVDFKNLNKNKESAIMICISGYKACPSFGFIECVSYLVEVVKVDLSYNYEETLYLAEGQEMITYIELQLAKININITKKDIDKYLPQVKIVKDFNDNSKGPLFTEEVRQYLDDGRSILSSIACSEVRYDIVSSSLATENVLE